MSRMLASGLISLILFAETIGVLFYAYVLYWNVNSSWADRHDLVRNNIVQLTLAAMVLVVTIVLVLRRRKHQ